MTKFLAFCGRKLSVGGVRLWVRREMASPGRLWSWFQVRWTPVFRVRVPAEWPSCFFPGELWCRAGTPYPCGCGRVLSGGTRAPASSPKQLSACVHTREVMPDARSRPAARRCPQPARTRLPRTRAQLPRPGLPRTRLPRTRLPRTRLPRTRLPRTRFPRPRLPRPRLPRPGLAGVLPGCRRPGVGGGGGVDGAGRAEVAGRRGPGVGPGGGAGGVPAGAGAGPLRPHRRPGVGAVRVRLRPRVRR